MVSAIMGSSLQLPPKARFVRCRPVSRAAAAVQMADGESTLPQWLIELP
jgi:hypothetical protein